MQQVKTEDLFKIAIIKMTARVDTTTQATRVDTTIHPGKEKAEG